jgi:hypothetical protein
VKTYIHRARNDFGLHSSICGMRDHGSGIRERPTFQNALRS